MKRALGSTKRGTTLGLGAIIVAVTALTLGGASAALASTALEPVPGEHVKAVAASSTSPEANPQAMTDGRLGTGWISDPGQSVGQTITLSFETTRYLTRVDILPGLGRDNVSFKRHARPSRIRVSWDGGEQVFDVRDKRTTQTLALAGLARTKELRITVEGVHGSATHGVAISEITGFEPQDILEVAPALRDKIEEDVLRLGYATAGEEAMERVISYGRPVVPWLVDHVARADAKTGEPAFRALVRLDRETAHRLIRDALVQGPPAQAALALRVLPEAEAEGMEGALIEAIERLSGELSLVALDNLAATGDRRALPRLEAALGSGDARRMNVAASRLSVYEDAGRAVAARHSASEDERVRLAAIAALGGFDEDSEAVAALAPLTAHASPITRHAAIRGLGRVDSGHARAALGKLLEAPQPADRGVALEALVAHDDQALPMIRQLLARDDDELHSAIMDHMAEARAPGARRLLIDAVLAVDAPTWHRHAVRALAAHGRSGVDALLQRVRAYPNLASRASGFLDRVSGLAARSAMIMLGDLGPDREYDDLRVLLLDTLQAAAYGNADVVVIRTYKAVTTSDRVRRRALESLGYLKTQAAKDLTLAAMDHADPQLARLALQASGRLGDERAIPKVLERLQSRHVRDWSPDAVEALGALRARDAVPMFQERMSYATRGIQLAILRACHRIGGRGAVRILIDASVSNDISVARVAHQLLSKPN